MKRKTATARKQRFPGNIENGGINSRRQPPAELNRIMQMEGKFCSNGLEQKNWNTSKGLRLFRKMSRVPFAFKQV